MFYFTLARTIDDQEVAAKVVGLGLDAMRFSSRHTKVLFPDGLGSGFGAQFGVVAAQVADDLRSGDHASANRGLDAIIAGEFEDSGSQACAVLFKQSCIDFLDLTSNHGNQLATQLTSAFAQTLDAAVLTLMVAQSDEAWSSVAESMAMSQEIDVIHKAYLTYGGLDAEFLGYVAALESSGRPDRETYAIQVAANYREEAAEMRQGKDLLDALDFAHHVAAIATYAALLLGDANGPDAGPRRMAGEVATSCGSSLLTDIFGPTAGEGYPLLIDEEYTQQLRAASKTQPADATSWTQVVPDALRPIALAIDARAGQPSVVAP